MNELQIRLSADITALQSALTKAKNTIKSFEDTTNKESEKGNVGFKRKIGLIEQLTLKAKNLRTALSQATNETQVAKYNAQLEETSRELTRLNALGRSVSANLGSTANGFGQVARQGANAQGVAIEFNRVIQDSPFGLIGVGNNLQQLAGNFAQVSKQAGGTGAAIKASLGALISPVNLALLAVSALTAGFTAYQMGAFDFLKSNEAAAKSLQELADEIDNAQSKTAAESANIAALRTVIEDETVARDMRLKAVERLQSKYPEIFANADKEKLLNGELIQSYDLLTKAIIQRAEASLAEERIPQLNKEKQVVDNQIQSLQRKLALEEAILAATSKGAAPSGLSIVTGSTAGTGQGFDAFAVQEAKVAELNKEIDKLSVKSKGLDINIQGFAQSIVSYNEEFINLLEPVNSSLDRGADKVSELAEEFTDQKWQDAEAQLLRINQLLSPIAGNIEPNFASGFTPNADVADQLDPEENARRIEELNRLLDGQKLKVEDLSQAFTGLGAVIGKAFNNPQFGTFIGQFAQFVTKIVAGAFAVSKANAVAGATQSSLFTGPAAAFTLPAFIAGAVGLVASAFAGIGGGGSRGGGGSIGAASSGAPPQIFTNANTVQPPSPSTPSPSGSIDFERAQGSLEARISGEDIVFTYDRYKERQRGGG